VIGLEVHAQLLTKSKIFTSDSTAFGAPPNTQVSVITLAHPGALPKLNKKALEYAIRMGIACQSDISRFTIFDRKNYFYPDLPKGYQITQDRTPICKGGHITISKKDGSESKIALTKIHLEDDAGKSIHESNETDTLLDFNRAGVPLIEIVTDPCISTSEEAYACLTEIRKLVRYLEICDGNMEEGSLRCDANVSVMLADAKVFGKKVEVKNMNSIRNVQRAIDHEIERQIGLIEKGEEVISETRTFEASSGKTFGMRTKEELNDYRYFPDPDLSPVVVSEQWLAEIKASMPALPNELRDKFMSKYGLSVYDAHVLTDSKDIALYFEELCTYTKNYKAAANWILGPVKSHLNEVLLAVKDFPIPIQTLAELIQLIDSNTVSFSVASQRIFPVLLVEGGKSALTVAKELNLIQDSSIDTILPIVEQVIREFPAKVQEYKKGKNGILGMFMGEVMKRSKGKADPQMANELLLKKLSEL
ncbi:MAG TPA: Asp-tRNA(Asn)/Glu-tRNA(Gln) amidotransferase subunit GatB, partial [Cyclobacteriaceae bacterium]|nr:Asp-tRNA(Asn)/Glu-tRNA(Gln) amidotransferase subunit GatB [Cyclobacteriaceae bacterium]